MSLHVTLKLHVNENILGPNNQQEHPVVFEERFLRCRPLLQFLACRILASHEEVENGGAKLQDYGVAESAKI